MVLAPSSDLLVTWDDGHTSLYEPLHLRRSCPCATCRTLAEKRAEEEANEKERRRKGGAGEARRPLGLSPLAIVKGPAVTELEAEGWGYVGNYAINIRWRDGHSTGIYSYKYLREICPCDECRAQRAAAATRDVP